MLETIPAFQEFKPNIQAEASRDTSPNRGASKLDLKAVSSDRLSIDEWRKQAGIDTSKQIRLVKLSHMRYQHPDLSKINTFLKGKRALHTSSKCS